MQKKIKIVSVFAVGAWAAALITAQAPPPPMGPGELDNLVQRIALYPDAIRFRRPISGRISTRRFMETRWHTRFRRIIYLGIPACRLCCRFRKRWN
jgi:hypothetical protein